MRIHFGKYAYYWHLVPTIKMHLEIASYDKSLIYFSLEFGFLKWWVELIIINTFSGDE